MEAIEQTEAPKPKKTAKRKPARRAAAPRAPKAATPDPAGEFGGMTSTECCFECREGFCVIGGKVVCGHPNKGGGTQPAIMRDPEATAIFQRARKELAVAAVKNR